MQKSNFYNLPDEDKPREKLILKGAEALSDVELLAIMLRTGRQGKTVLEMAHELYEKNSKNLAFIATKSPKSIKNEINGIGDDKAATLAACFELARRINLSDRSREKQTFNNPKIVADYFIPYLKSYMQEKFVVVCLNSASKMLIHKVITEGTVNGTMIEPREVFKFAVENVATSIILIHNHPSGNPEPSHEDIQLTKRMVEAGKIMNIQVVDHIIIADTRYTSFAERRLL